MDKGSLAEWLLERATSSKRAAEIVGDLLEERGRNTDQASLTVFWCRVARVFFRLGWRGMIAPVGAFFSIFIPVFAFTHLAGPHAHGPFAQLAWMTWAVPLLGFSGCLWSVFLLSAVSYGFRDFTTQLGLLFALLSTAAISFAWLPSAGYVFVVVALVVVVTTFALQVLRRHVLCVTVVAGGAALVYLLVDVLSTHLAAVARTSGTRMLLSWSGPPAWLLCVIIQVWLLRRTRRRFLSA